MVPVRDLRLKLVTHGLPLVPPKKPPHSNLTWYVLCLLVWFLQVTGASVLDGYPVTRTTLSNPGLKPIWLAPSTSSMFFPSFGLSTTKPTSRSGSDDWAQRGSTSSLLGVHTPYGVDPST